MSKTVEITCDACANDLTTSSNMVDYRLALVNESVPSESGCVTAMVVYPAINRNVHFCGVDCLRAWLDKEYPAGEHYPDGKAWAEYQRKQRAAGKPRQWK